MLVNALIVGFVLMFAKAGAVWGNLYFNQPIFTVMLIGLFLGKPIEGIMIGAALQLVFLGVVNVGGQTPQDLVIGSVLGGAYALILGKSVTVAIALAVPISLLGVFLVSIINMIFTANTSKFEKYVRERNEKAFLRLYAGQIIVLYIFFFLLGFVSIYFGTNAIQGIIDWIPDAVMSGLSVSAGMLPALGFALLLLTLWKGEYAIYFALGFAIAGYAKIPIMGIAIFATIIALYIFYDELKKKKITDLATQQTVVSVADEEEDFFNE